MGSIARSKKYSRAGIVKDSMRHIEKYNVAPLS